MTKFSTTPQLIIVVFALCPSGGCFFDGSSDELVVHRQPWQMIDARPNAFPRNSATTPATLTFGEYSSKRAGASPGTTKRLMTRPPPKRSDATPAEAIENARADATQHPATEDFVDAVQVYDYEPGAVYEVLTTPGFVTVLRLRPEEELLHLAAGDTSRWLIDIVSAGTVDPKAVLSDEHVTGSETPQLPRVSVLIKPRRPSIETNLVIATTERTYLIDLKSVETNAYHSVVEWTYPRHLPTPPPVASQRGNQSPESAIRNYAYVIKRPPDIAPPWMPESVYDDGHRVYIQFSKIIDDVRRPPLFIVGNDGSVHLVNYHVKGRTYVVHELFDHAELRIGSARVVIERIKKNRPGLFTRLGRAIGIGD